MPLAPLRVSSALLLGPYRRRRARHSPAQIQSERLKAREWVFPSQDLEHRGLIWDHAPDAPWLLHFYGAGMSVDQEIGRLSWLHQRFSMNVACVDYRGYARTGGAWDAGRLIQDAIAAHDQLRLVCGQAPIHLHGFSMGAALAAHVSAVREVASLILLAPPFSFEDCRSDFLDRWPPLRWLNDRWPPEIDPALPAVLDARRSVEDLSTPLLVIHGDRDRTIHIRQGEKLYWASSAETKIFIRASGCTHCTLPYQGGLYEEALENWFSQEQK